MFQIKKKGLVPVEEYPKMTVHQKWQYIEKWQYIKKWFKTNLNFLLTECWIQIWQTALAVACCGSHRRWGVLHVEHGLWALFWCPTWCWRKSRLHSWQQLCCKKDLRNKWNLSNCRNLWPGSHIRPGKHHTFKSLTNNLKVFMPLFVYREAVLRSSLF